MVVSKRIKTIESLVPSGTRLLDVGSDHAFLPISLFLQGRIRGAVVSDVNEGPLAAGRENVARLAPALLPLTDFVLSDGFNAVDRDSYDAAAVCGMGGELIARIIDEAGDKARVPLVLQPMTQADRLRSYLWEHGFEIRDERFATEGHRPYVVIAVEYTGENTPYSYADTYLGRLRPQGADFSSYARKVHAAAEKRLIGARRSGDGREIQRIEELIRETSNYF